MIKIIIKSAATKLMDLVCPPATQDLELNTKNRNAAIQAEHIQYGPLNLTDEEYWNRAAEHWKTTADVAKKSKCSNCVAFDISPRMKECMPGSVQEDGELGYCWMHHFKCHSARTCYTWAAGGPISDDKTSSEWQEKNKGSLEERNFFANMRAKQKRCKGKPKTGECAEDRPTKKQWKKITAKNESPEPIEEFYEVDALNEDEEYCPVCREAQELKEKKKKPCKPSKGKRFAKRVDGKCRSYGQAGQAKGGGDRIRPGTKKGDAYCARSAGIKKCKNPPCANTLSRKKWKCRGKKSMKEE